MENKVVTKYSNLPILDASANTGYLKAGFSNKNFLYKILQNILYQKFCRKGGINLCSLYQNTWKNFTFDTGLIKKW